MGGNRIAIASVVLVVLIGLFVWQMQAREAEIDAKPDVEITLPKIEKDAIDELVLAAPERPKVRHVKQAGEWKLVEPLAAKSDQAAIRTALDKLAELEVTGVAATKKENHARLEVDEAKGARVTAKAGGKTVVDLWIGSYRAGNSMLRKEGEDAVATVKGSIRFAFSKFLREWRDRNVVSLDTDHVRTLELTSSKGHFRFVKEASGWVQAPGEAPIARFDAEKVKSLVTMIATLDATDFAEDGLPPEQTGLGEGAASVLVTTESDAGPGQVLLRIGAVKGNDHYLERDGVATRFLVGKWVAERLTSGADGFQAAEEGAAEATPGSPQAPTPGHPIDPHSPDMQRQIQQALQQAQQQRQ